LHVASGATVTTVILTDGSGAGDPTARLQESAAAAALLGSSGSECWFLADRCLAYGEGLVQRMLAVMRETQSEIVYAPSLWENHPDHRATALASFEAARRYGQCSLMFYETSAPLRPNFLLDISTVAERKQAAMACFPSQLALQPYDRQISALNRFRTYTLPAAVTAAEGFEYYDAAALQSGKLAFLQSEYDRQSATGLIRMPDDAPLVSVLIRSMNRPVLGRALASVAAQTWPHIEILVVNAGGGGHRQLSENCGGFPVRFVDNPHPLHRCAAANQALQHASGDYLLFLDDDDQLEGDHVAKLAGYLQQHPETDLVHTGVRGVDPAGQVQLSFTLDAPRSRLLLGNFMPIHAVMFRAALLHDTGARFDESLDIYEDWDFWLQLTKQGALAFVPGISAVYHLLSTADHPVHNQSAQAEATRAMLEKWAPCAPPELLLGLRQYAEGLETGQQQLLEALDACRVDITTTTRQHHRLIEEHQSVVAQHHRLIEEHQSVVAQHHRLIEEHQSVVAQHHRLIEEHQHLYASRSWRFTKPLRALGVTVRGSDWLIGPLRKAKKVVQVVRHEGFAGLWKRLGQRAGLPTMAGQGGQPPVSSVYLAWLQQHDRLQAAEKEQMLDRARAAGSPCISVVMPTYNPNLAWLSEALESVRSQDYPYWELCIADDASGDPAVRELLEEYCRKDQRIKAVFRANNGHISAATKSALVLAGGDFVCFLDHDDLLHPEALLCLADAVAQNGQADILYTDEDKAAPDGSRCLPFFKPDWSPHLAISQAYLGHLVCYRHSLLQEVGGLREGLEGAQDYDLWLRASLKARAVVHLPRVLYHWRMHEGSTALVAGSKPYAHEVGRKAVADYLQHRYPGQSVSAVDGESLFTYAARFSLPQGLMISIIIPTRNGLDLLRPCIKSICQRSTWQSFEIVILDNGSDDPATLRYLEELPQHDGRVRVVRAALPFNWSQLNNIGSREARGDLFIFLNNDTQVITPDWLQHLGGYALLPDVGMVGGLLLFEDGTIQHSGVVVGMGGWADHPFRTLPAVHSGGGPFVSPVLTRNVLAVTGACLAISRQRLEELGGFDESFIICGSDVELGLRAHQQGYYNVICAEAKLYHLESKTRTPHIPDTDFRQSALKYEPYRTLQVDPFYNPNLSRATSSPMLKAEP
jgi:glycosyltransferase involved in cell wall biosynthesis/LmbE family N-acetylglucosaminyl deacetylase